MQAARGTPLSTEPPARPASRGPRAAVWFAIAVLLAWALDQVTKILAVEHLKDADPVELVPGLLELTFLRNPGAAFGMGTSMTVVLTAVSVGVIVVVARMASRLVDPAWTVGLGLLLAGALGNLTDRIFREPETFRGHVVDFIDYAGFFVGNVADIYLTVAAGIIIVRTFQGVSLDGTRADARQDGQ